MEIRDIPQDDGSTVSASVARPATGGPGAWPAVILAHGAGTDRTHASLVGWQQSLTDAGYLTVVFNFPYRERGKKLPDARPVLERCWRAVIRHVRSAPDLRPTWLALGGRSMGGRMATYVALEDLNVAALVLLAYPLHPAGQPEKLRADHLAQVHAPTLFIQGTRDPLADPARLEAAIASMPSATLHRVAEGDHGFRVPKRTGRTADDVQREIADTMIAWLEAQRA